MTAVPDLPPARRFPWYDVVDGGELEQGDIVNVSDRSYNKIFVLGEIAKPGSLVMNKKRSTLAEVLSDATVVWPLLMVGLLERIRAKSVTA